MRGSRQHYFRFILTFCVSLCWWQKRVFTICGWDINLFVCTYMHEKGFDNEKVFRDWKKKIKKSFMYECARMKKKYGDMTSLFVSCNVNYASYLLLLLPFFRTFFFAFCKLSFAAEHWIRGKFLFETFCRWSAEKIEIYAYKWMNGIFYY